MPEKQLALFDFDGTITHADSMLELARFHRGTTGYWATMATLAPGLALHKLGAISATIAKQRFLSAFFGGMVHEHFNELCHRFCQQKLPMLLRPAALERLRWHQQQGHQVYLVSASAVTGRLANNNCNGEEKLRRIKAELALEEYSEIYAYGDSSGDTAMLSIATQPHFKPFRN
ncbi:MAG: haloacid dehalogenase-like hydrolase [Chitinophagaceae bacterium]|nr:haloacid dehalogenase-like hydrolase [Chitinophagaceae bacterium]